MRLAALSQTNSSASGLPQRRLRVTLGSPNSETHHSALRLSIASIASIQAVVTHLLPLPYDTLGCAEELSKWQPKGSPVLLPPNGMEAAVESIVGALSSMATTWSESTLCCSISESVRRQKKSLFLLKLLNTRKYWVRPQLSLSCITLSCTHLDKTGCPVLFTKPRECSDYYASAWGTSYDLLQLYTCFGDCTVVLQ